MKTKAETDISTGRRVFRVSCDCRPLVFGILCVEVLILISVAWLGWMVLMGVK
jgi:hypothetical protein